MVMGWIRSLLATSPTVRRLVMGPMFEFTGAKCESYENCMFCKIIKGEMPSYKLLETELSYAFLDIFPLAKGHALVIPKYHAEKLHDVPDEYLVDILTVAKKVAIAEGLTDYNVLQNNGPVAHQVVPHVHFHVIPKPGVSDKQGLVVGWPQQKVADEELKQLHEEIKSKL